jgi:hypothetical protein
MDTITLILTALMVGAAATTKEKASIVAQDAYYGLKALIRRKFEGKTAAVIALIEYEKEPEIWKAPLEKELKETGSGEDQEIIAVAQKLLALIQPEQAAMGKYNVKITGNVQSIVMGDKQQVTTSFGDISKEK